MTDRLDLPLRYRKELEALLRQHVPDAEVWAYGGRVNGQSHEASGLDLVLRGPNLEPLGYKYVELVEALEQSNIPILVQAHDWARLPESFHREIERDYVVVQEGDCGWREVTLGEIAKFNDATYSPKESWPFINYLDTGNITENRITDIQCLVAGADKIPSRARRKVQPGDIVYSTVRPNQRHFGLIKDVPSNFLASTGFAVIRGKEDVACTDFIYWFLAQDHIVEYLHSIAENSTSAYPSIRPGDLEQLTLSLPPLPEQHSIAQILGALDDKIELNRRMNRTLEAMARAIFQDWFVDFGPVRAKLEGCEPYLPPELWALFPDRLADSELGEVPEGWEVKALGDVVEVIGGATPSTKVPGYWEGGTHYWATPKDLSTSSTSILLDTERRITDTGLAKISSGLLPRGSLLLSSRAPIGYLAITEEPTAINQGFIAMPPSKRVSSLFMLHWCKAFHEEIVNHANGSTFLEISKTNFRRIEVALADEGIMAQFDQRVRSFYERIATNERESRVLVAQRDALLPKLVSGEVRVEST